MIQQSWLHELLCLLPEGLVVGLEVHVEPEAGGGLVVALGAGPLAQVRLGQVHLQVRLVGRREGAVVARAPIVLLALAAAAVPGLGVLGQGLPAESVENQPFGVKPVNCLRNSD